MNNNLFNQLMELNLPEGKYAIFGSGPLAVREIRENRDLDLIVTEELFNEYLNNSNWELKRLEDGNEYLKNNNFEIEFYKNWAPGDWDVKKLIKEAEIINGLPFVKLEEVLRWKKIKGREKDLKDIELIKNYLDKK